MKDANSDWNELLSVQAISANESQGHQLVWTWYFAGMIESLDGIVCNSIQTVFSSLLHPLESDQKSTILRMTVMVTAQSKNNQHHFTNKNQEHDTNVPVLIW